MKQQTTISADALLQTLAWAAVQEIRTRRRERLQWWRSLMTVTPYALGRFQGLGESELRQWQAALRAEIRERRERGQW
jgi:hypothetical protein